MPVSTDKISMSTPRKLSIPKSLGACADKLHKIREERLQADKLAAQFKAQESELREHIIQNLSKSAGDTGAVGKNYKAIVTEKDVPQIKNPKKFYKWLHKNQASDVMQKRLNPAAINDRLEELTPKQRKKGIPGIEMFNSVGLSLTKK